MATDICWLIIFFLVGLTLLVERWHRRQPQGGPAAVQTTVHRRLRPRTPDDCPACRQATPCSPMGRPICPPPVPWQQRKSRRGAPKRIATQGYACPKAHLRLLPDYRCADPCARR